MQNSKNYEFYDIDTELNGVPPEDVREESQSKKFFLSKLSFENLKRVCSRIKYFGNRGMKKLSDNIAVTKDELNYAVEAKELLERKMQTSSKLKTINDRISIIQNSDLTEEDKEKALESPEKEKKEFIDNIQTEIDKLEDLKQDKEEKLDYLNSVKKEKQEQILKKAEKKELDTNRAFDNIRISEENSDEKISESVNIDEDTIASISEGIAKQGEQYVTAVEESQFAGLDEYYDNFLKQLGDVEKSVNTLRNSYKTYTKNQIQNLKSAHEDAIKRLKENYEGQLKNQKIEHKTELENYKSTIMLKDREVADLNETVAVLDKKLETKTYQLSEKDSSINELEEKNRTLEQKIAAKDLEISSLKQEKEKVVADNLALKEIIERFKNQNAMLKSQNAMLESQNKMLSETNKTISEQNEGLINLVDQFNNDGFSAYQSNPVEETGVSMVKK